MGKLRSALSLKQQLSSDNGTGVPKEKVFEQLVFIGASKKNPKIKKGFRG